MKPKYYKELDEIFHSTPSIFNSNEVVSGLEESSTAASDFIHIKNEYPKNNVVEIKKPISNQDNILADQTENSQIMNDNKIIIGMPPTL